MKNELVSSVHSGEIVTSRFDYGCLEASVAKFLKGQANRIRRSFSNATIQIGKDLIGAKHYLSHGEFLRWVEDEVGMPARTAQVYMRAAQWARNKDAIVAHLPPTLLYILSAPSTPEELTKALLERIEAGEQIEILAVRKELKKLRDHKQSGRVLANDADRWTLDSVAGSDNLVAIIEAITIMCQRLSDTDFARVRMIFTDDRVLHDPALNKKIAVAFARAPRPSTGSRLPMPKALEPRAN